MSTAITGSCHCGAVSFELTPPLRESISCHCVQCRKTSGHYWSATSVPLDRFRLTAETGLRWFQSSPEARRGFCRICGSSLFWERHGEGRISVASGALDAPTGIQEAQHIFCADKGDYYLIADDLPRIERF